MSARAPLLTVVLLATALVPRAGGADTPAIHCVPSKTINARCADSHRRIQGAIYHAKAGDAVLIAPGVYYENLGAIPPDVVVRGLDRNTVIIEGGIDVDAWDVEVSNLTVRNGWGIHWRGAEGLARYVTSYNNELGFQAYSTSGVVFEDSLASGNVLFGFGMTECVGCGVVRRVVAERNGLGFAGVNAAGAEVRDSQWLSNGAGILLAMVPDTRPQAGVEVVSNQVVDSGGAGSFGWPVPVAHGMGIAIAGGSGNLVRYNAVEGSSRYGIAIFPYDPSATPGPSRFVPAANRIEGNRLFGSGVFDAALAAGSGAANCFAWNEFSASDPPMIQSMYGCYETVPTALPVSGSPVTSAELAAFTPVTARPCGEPCPPPAAQQTMADPTADLP